MEEEWKTRKNIVINSTKEVTGTSKIKRQEYFDEE